MTASSFRVPSCARRTTGSARLTSFTPLTAATLLALALSVPGPAGASDGAYIGSDVGIALFDVTAEEFDLNEDGNAEQSAGIDTKTGLIVNGAVGYGFQGPFRVEVEGTYGFATIDEKALEGEVSLIGGFLNGYVDFEGLGPLQPHIGAGIGAARVTFDTVTVDEDDFVPAYNAMAGLDMDFDGRMTVSAEYRFIDTTRNPSLDGASINIKGHIIQAGARLHF